jgi:pyridoxal phosphate enzyme (YggS family)
VRAAITQAEHLHARAPGSVRLLAVSKRQSADAIRELAALGQRDFGENYVQEAVAKQAELADLALCWHFIGRIQGNKTREIAAHFDWVHSLERVKHAQRLSAQRSDDRPALNLCLQINLEGEQSKGGLAPEQVAATAAAVAVLPRLRLRGLMTIPATHLDAAQQLAVFTRLHELQRELVRGGLNLDTLSMGMSADMEIAIVAGATMVRIGTALFGPRP